MSEPFHTLTADPPWHFSDRLPGKGRGASNNYQTLKLADIMAFGLPPLADDCRLFLWRVSSMVEEAYKVVRAWGFTPKSEIVWNKTTVNGNPWVGMGRQVRNSHESVIIAVRGRPARLSASVLSRFSAPVGKHSAKPEIFYTKIVEKLSPGPYCELFGRRPREGWTVYGNQVSHRFT